MNHASHIRTIVRDEIRQQDLWTYLLGDSRMESAVSRQVNSYLERNLTSKVQFAVNSSVSTATQRMKIDALETITTMLKDNARMQSVISTATIQAQHMVTQEVNSGRTQISDAVANEVENVVRADRYNTVNKAFQDDLAANCHMQLNKLTLHLDSEIKSLKATNDQLTLEVREKCAELDTTKTNITNLQNNQRKVFVSSSVVGAFLGVSAILFIESLK